jgi:hypothetical protein
MTLEHLPHDMILDDLKAKLANLKPGQMAGIHHDVYANLFPPGEPDENARAACYGFAKHFAARSLQQKIPFLARVSETGSISAGGACSLVQIISATQ